MKKKKNFKMSQPAPRGRAGWDASLIKSTILIKSTKFYV